MQLLFLVVLMCNSSLKATDAVLELIFLNNLRSLHILAYFHCIKQRISDPTSIMIKHAFLKRLLGRILQYQMNLQAYRHILALLYFEIIVIPLFQIATKKTQ